MADKRESEDLELDVVYDRTNDMRVIGPFLNKRVGIEPGCEHALTVTADRIRINVLHAKASSEEEKVERLSLREFLHKYGGGLIGVVNWSDDPETGVLKMMYFMPEELRNDAPVRTLVRKYPGNQSGT